MSGNPVIPAEAVEAAWDKLHENPIRPIGIAYAELEAALEAAAPHMLAGALTSAAHAMELMPPMLRAQYVATLRLYAAEPWRLGTVEPTP